MYLLHAALQLILYVSLASTQGPVHRDPVTQGPASPPLPASNQVCLIVPPDVEQCYREFQGKPIDDKAAQVNCLQKLLWNFVPDINNTQTEISYFQSLAGDIGAFTASSILRHGNPRPPTGRRARQEYRTLTQQQRQRFHAALNKLYEDGTIRAFARLHARSFTIHHNGPSFLPWHRVFLVMFEEALRRIDPTVSLPFWDSTMDNGMDNPVNSVLWSSGYFGNGIGDVMSGPAAGWVTDQGNLERNYGQASRLFSKDQIRRILSRCELQQISQPTADIAYDFELYHGGAHVWIGGDMASPASTAYDPIFYLHQAFVDYVWELFRRRQFRRCGIDPTQDYPNVNAGNSHAPESPMTGFEWLTNADGLKHYWIDNWYYYESTPSCPNCCIGCPFPAPIYCDRRRRGCVSRSRRTFAFGPRDRNTTQEAAFARASLDPAEIEAISNPTPPRNRGLKFRHPPNDGRTIHTAISDAFSAVTRDDQTTRTSQSSPRDRTTADRRASPRASSSRGNRRRTADRRTLPDGRSSTSSRGALSGSRRQSADRRSFPESWGPPIERGSAADINSPRPRRRTLSDFRSPAPDRTTLFSGQGSPPDRRLLPDGRTTSTGGRALVDNVVTTHERELFIDGRGVTPDTRSFSTSGGPRSERRSFSSGIGRQSERRISSNGVAPDTITTGRRSRGEIRTNGRIPIPDMSMPFADPRGGSRVVFETGGPAAVLGSPRSSADGRRLPDSRGFSGDSRRLLPAGSRGLPSVGRLSLPDRGIARPGGRLAPLETMIRQPEIRAFSTDQQTKILDMRSVNVASKRSNSRSRGRMFTAPR